MSEPKFKLSPPWIIYVAKLKAMFDNDPEIEIEYDNDDNVIDIRVDNEEKAAALTLLLPYEKKFGNVTLAINIVPSNNSLYRFFRTAKEVYDTAFENNPVYAFSYVVEGLFSSPIVYIVFKNRVVQFFADNLADIHGNISTLYQNLAAEIFDESCFHGVNYCTDIEEKVGKPLGEWP